MSAQRLAADPRRRATARAASSLSAHRSHWLAALLVAVAGAAAAVPAGVGRGSSALLLVGLRLLFLRRDRARGEGDVAAGVRRGCCCVAAVVAGVAVRFDFGYFARPRALRRVPVRARRHQVPRGARRARRRAARVPRELPDRDAVLLQPVAARRRRRAAGAAADRGGAAATDRSRGAGRGAARRRGGAVLARGVADAAAGHAAGGCCCSCFFPRLAAPLWGLPADHAAKTGLSDRMAPGLDQRALAVRRDRVSRRLRRPRSRRRRQRYWRGPVLSRLRRPRVDRDGTAAARPLRARRTSSRSSATRSRWSRTTSRGCSRSTCRSRRRCSRSDAGADLRVVAGRHASRATSSSSPAAAGDAAAALPPAVGAARLAIRPMRASLARRESAAYPQLPRSYAQPARRSRSRGAARATHPDDAELHRAVLAWFTARAVRLHAGAARCSTTIRSTRFLFDTRRGFCEHYASAFVVLLRAAGIPARVVTGYQGGEINPRGGYMIVRQSDAHAWAEALIDGEWQRYDPTAAVAPSRIEMGLGGALPTSDRCRCSRASTSAGSRRSSSPGTRSTTTGAARSSASTTSGSARCGATGSSTACRGVADRRRWSARSAPAWVGACCSAGSLWRRRQRDRGAGAVAGALPPARARRPAARSRTKARSTTPTRAARALAGVRRRVPGHRRSVRGAALRPRVGARGLRPPARRGAGPPRARDPRAAARALGCSAAATQRRAAPGRATAARRGRGRRRFEPRAQLVERLGLDLPHALAGDADLAAPVPRASRRRSR